MAALSPTQGFVDDNVDSTSASHLPFAHRENLSPQYTTSEMWYAVVAQQLKPKGTKKIPKAMEAMQQAWDKYTKQGA